MEKEKKGRLRRSRIQEFGMVAATMLLGMSRVCYANPITPGPVERMFFLGLIFSVPFTFFLFGAGLFLYVRMLIVKRELTVHDGRSQLYIIGCILIGLFTSAYLIGIWFYYKGIRKAIEMYRAEFALPDGELLGRRRAVNMIAAIVLLIAADMMIIYLPRLGACVDSELLDIVIVLLTVLYDFLVLFGSGPLFDSVPVRYPVFIGIISAISAFVWLVCFVRLLFQRHARGQELRGAFLNGLAVFGYIIIGNCSMPFVAWPWFYYLAVRHAIRVYGKYHGETVPQSAEETVNS